MRKGLLILLVCLASGILASAGNKPYPFRGGESASYYLLFKWGLVNTEVGNARFQLDSVQFEGQDAYHISFKGQSAPFFDIFYKIREDFHSWVRTEDLRPISYTRDTYEGGYTATNLFTYDWSAKEIKADVKYGDKERQFLSIPLKEKVYDLPALIYQVRTLDFANMKPGQKTTFRFAIDDDIYSVNITFKGKGQLKARRLGNMETYRVACSLVSGAVFEGNEDLLVWFTADGHCVPVAVKAPLRVGTVWAWLSEYKYCHATTSNPFTSLRARVLWYFAFSFCLVLTGNTASAPALRQKSPMWKLKARGRAREKMFAWLPIVLKLPPAVG